MATQPGTGLTLFQPGQVLPDYMKSFVQQHGGNIAPRQTVPSLGLKGKVWAISIDGNQTPLQRRNNDGDLEPLPIFKAIVLNYNTRRGRQFYPGTYDPNNTSPPVCWSEDGITPDASLPGPFAPGTLIEPGKAHKVASNCASCPNAVKGSKIIEGTNRQTTACAEHRMLALLPAPELGLPAAMNKPLRLKIAITSDWDGQSPAEEQQGWMSWSKYVDWLYARGCPTTALVVTKMKFDPEAAYPKIFFSSERPCTQEELASIDSLIESPDVIRLLTQTWTPAGVDGIPIADQEVATPLAASAVAQPARAPQAQLAPVAPVAPVGYQMAPGEGPTYEAYRAAGWNDDQLVAHGKLIAMTPPPAKPEAVVVVPPPQTDPVVAASPGIVVGESAAAVAVVVPPVVVVEEPKTSAPEKPVAPAPTQAPAQASAQVPTPSAPASEPPAAQAAAASATVAVSTEVPKEIADIMAGWGPDPAQVAA